LKLINLLARNVSYFLVRLGKIKLYSEELSFPLDFRWVTLYMRPG